jgi:hypothetical protein
MLWVMSNRCDTPSNLTSFRQVFILFLQQQKAPALEPGRYSS